MENRNGRGWLWIVIGLSLTIICGGCMIVSYIAYDSGIPQSIYAGYRSTTLMENDKTAGQDLSQTGNEDLMTKAEWEESFSQMQEDAGANPEPIAEPVEPVELVETQVDRGSLPEVVSTWQQGKWEVREFEDVAANDPIVKGWMKRLRDPDPTLWVTYPNIRNDQVPEFRVVECEGFPGKECVPDGMEYGTHSTPFCWSNPCDIIVGAWEFRYVSGDYEYLDLACSGDGTKGCLLLLLNVHDESYTWRDQYVDNGFTLRGRYFNGDALEWGVWGLVSHGSANMLNMPTKRHPDEMLNSSEPGNSGANCGNPAGCPSVDVNVVVTSGDRILAVAHTVVTR